jgi:hypothetical protein
MHDVIVLGTERDIAVYQPSLWDTAVNLITGSRASPID